MSDAGRGIERTRVTVEGNSVVAELCDGRREFELCTLPEVHMDWIDTGRRNMYAQLKGKGEPVRFFAQHLPVLVTYSAGKPFPFNCCNKGVGFIPKARYLSECIELFQTTLRDTRDKPWQESLARRLDVASRFFFDREKIDARAISTLEIFEKNTFRNLVRTPLASLLFTGEFPDYRSFQLNCAVEVLGPDDPRHTFILLARSLFEHDAFHIAQPRFNYAYVFWLTEVLDKTPVRVYAHPSDVAETEGGLHWHRDALTVIGRAPGMIQRHIREQIETYARAKGHTEVSVALVQQAKDELMNPGPGAARPRLDEDRIRTYRRIYVCLDGSELSNAAQQRAVAIGRRAGAELIGSHVYAAKLHDRRFRSMESGLPEEYQKEGELEKQREIHDSLITKGLELISDSYLERMQATCLENNLSFRGVSLEGRNWQELAKDIERSDYDLVALGGHGVGRVAGALLGSVAERVLRRVKRDILLCKADPRQDDSDSIVVCLDGSVRSWGALQRGIQLAKAFQKKLVAVSAFDPYFHYTMFSTLNRTLTDKARKVFKFEEQERLHEDIIDSGLAKIYQSHLDIAHRIAADEGIELETYLLDGKAYEKILEFVRAAPPWLLILGRTGIHSDEEMDIGGHTENICRKADCDVLIVDTRCRPPVEYQAAETVTWTAEAQTFLKRVPAMARGVARSAVQNHCIAEGHTVVTTSVLIEAVRQILPRSAAERMGIDFDADQESESRDRIDPSFRCTECGYVHHGLRPRQCPICGEAGSTFKLVEAKPVEDGIVSMSMDGRELSWERAALERLEAADPVLRRQLEAKLEKQALAQRLFTITLEMVLAAYPSGKRGPVWTDAAVRRLERVPAGFMRNAAKASIEESARSGGLEEITLEVAECGLAQARVKMAQSLTTRVPPTSAAPEGSETSFECELCGQVVDGTCPDRCPACQAERLRGMTKDERARAPVTATRILSWDEDALARLERVPAGFMRTMTRCRVEQWARCKGLDRISLQVVEAKYESWAAGSASIECQLRWSPDALARLKKVPGFIRPMVAREIERNAEAAGLDEVDGVVMEGAMSRWGSRRAFHAE